MNTSEIAPKAPTRAPLVPYGLPGWEFDVTHGLAVCTLLTSLTISTGVLIHLRPGKGFSSWPIGDRIVVYIALSDEIYSWHLLGDQVWMWATRAFIPVPACRALAFGHWIGIMSQAIIVVFAALNAFTMVGFRRKLGTGRNDWRLLVAAYGMPVLVSTVGVATGSFGPSEAWCLIDLRNQPIGDALNISTTVLMLITLIFASVCYLGVWIKIRQSAKSAAQTANAKKYNRTARVMLLFVAAYIMQWWPSVCFGMWSLFAPPPLVLVLVILVFAPLGGLWNFIAYNLIRKRSLRVQQEETPATTTTADKA